MPDEPSRTRAARSAAEAALVRVVHHYGSRPEFVLIGGLLPEYLCSESGIQHAGTTDVDVQVDLEIACGSVNVRRLENALRNAEFQPDASEVWRWASDGEGGSAVVKFELLADDDEAKDGDILVFDDCDSLGAVKPPRHWVRHPRHIDSPPHCPCRRSSTDRGDLRWGTCRVLDGEDGRGPVP